MIHVGNERDLGTIDEIQIVTGRGLRWLAGISEHRRKQVSEKTRRAAIVVRPSRPSRQSTRRFYSESHWEAIAQMRARILLRESRLWFTQTMQEFRRACGKNLPHGLHGEGIVEAKTTEGLMPAHRPCLRAVAEQNSGRFLNRRPERSTLTFMLLDALEAPTEATPARHRRKRRTTPSPDPRWLKLSQLGNSPHMYRNRMGDTRNKSQGQTRSSSMLKRSNSKGLSLVRNCQT